MQPLEVDLRLVSLPLGEPFETAGGRSERRDVVVLHLHTDEGSGWGECAALAAPTYTSEYAAGAFDVLRHHLLPRLLRAPELDAGVAAVALGDVRGHPMAKAAVEMAVLDASLRRTGMPLARWLGGRRDRVPAGVAIGVAPTVGELVASVEQRVAEGYRRVKLKVRPGWDVEPVGAVRAAVGDDVALVADANGAYRRHDRAVLQRLDDLGLAAFEQPLPEDDLEGSAALVRVLRTPVCLDESVGSAAAAREAIAARACGAVSVKPGRVGGLAEARRVHDVCHAEGLPAWVGGMLETGIGRAAAIALASLPGFTLPGDVSASSRWFARDLTTTFELDADGCLEVPTEPGLGVRVDLEAVDAHTVRQVAVRT